MDTPEGAAYTKGRCQVALQVNPEEWNERTFDLAIPLYKKALDTVPEKGFSLCGCVCVDFAFVLGFS